MHYTLLFHSSQEEFAERAKPALWAAFMPYMQAVKDAGIFVTGAGLEAPETATTIRMQNGERLVQDGPFSEAKEQLGGLFVIDVPNLDVALEWAARYPLKGAVEVRPCLNPRPNE